MHNVYVYVHESNDEYALTSCRDGVDNDADGVLDMADSDCSHPQDQESSDFEDDTPQNPLPECADGIDHDGDTYIDWPHDLGCSAAGGVQEEQGCEVHDVEAINSLDIIDLASEDWWQDDTSTTDFAEGLVHASCEVPLSFAPEFP